MFNHLSKINGTRALKVLHLKLLIILHTLLLSCSRNVPKCMYHSLISQRKDVYELSIIKSFSELKNPHRLLQVKGKSKWNQFSEQQKQKASPCFPLKEPLTRCVLVTLDWQYRKCWKNYKASRIVVQCKNQRNAIKQQAWNYIKIFTSDTWLVYQKYWKNYGTTM